MCMSGTDANAMWRSGGGRGRVGPARSEPPLLPYLTHSYPGVDLLGLQSKDPDTVLMTFACVLIPFGR